jgi:23S rRNA (adenine2503-C2)-methyltransferase
MSRVTDNFKVFESSEGNVWKYVYESEDGVAESVLYKYDTFAERTVMCVSTMSGCPVGCTFCGTGKKFIRSLTAEEIVDQVKAMLYNHVHLETLADDIKKFQIMFMSMGEPFLNYAEVKEAIEHLHFIYPNAQLLLSTVGINNREVLEDFIELSCKIDKVGLQFSIHEAFEAKRNELIPYKNKLTLREIRDYGTHWSRSTGRPVYLNYCLTDKNSSDAELDWLKNLFSPIFFNFTFSVVCSADETMKEAGYKNLDHITKVSNSFLSEGYNVRVFNPAGQDDIGGGCGQLWYVQQWYKKHGRI